MARLTKTEAREIARNYGIRLDADFHTLDSGEVESVLAAAKARGYRKPPNANGSRGRYFHAYLRRAAGDVATDLRGREGLDSRYRVGPEYAGRAPDGVAYVARFCGEPIAFRDTESDAWAAAHEHRAGHKREMGIA